MNDARPTPPTADPGAIVRMSTAYWESQTLLTASRIKLFDALADGPRSAEDVARRLGTQPRQTTLLLKACTALGLLEHRDDRFGNAPPAAAFLVAGRPGYLGNVIRYADDLYAAWGALETSLKSGEPAVPPAQYLGQGASGTRAFVMAMHERALGVARPLVGLLELSGRRRLLDVGGGPGTYSVLLTTRFPDLHADVLELPGVAEVARELVAEAGASDRVTLRDGDYHLSDFGSGYDVVLMSGMFHRESEASCRSLIGRAAQALAPGGMLVISDVFADAEGTGPAFAALFGLNMMLTAPDGGVHADADVLRWMAAAGFGAPTLQALPPPMPHRVLTGLKA